MRGVPIIEEKTERNSGVYSHAASFPDQIEIDGKTLTKNISPDSASAISGIDLSHESAAQKLVKLLKNFEKQNDKLSLEQEKALEKFTALFENVRNAIVIINEKRQILKANSNFLKLSGYDQIDSKNFTIFTDLFVKKDRKKIERLLKSIDANATTDFFSTSLVNKDSSVKAVELNFARIPNQNQMIVFINDVTAHKKYEQEILRRNKELTVLNLISRSIKQPKDLQQLLHQVVETIGGSICLEMAAIFLGDRRLKNLQPVVTIGMTRENAKRLLENNLTLIQQVKKEKKELFLNPSNGFFKDLFIKQPKCRSVVLVPLTIRKSTTGILALTSKKQIQFDPETKQFISAIGHQLSIHIENSILFNELEKKTKEVEAKNKELSSFVFTVSHDLKTPIIALHGYLSLFVEYFQDKIDETGKEYLDRMLYNAEYMERMINDLLKLSRAGRVVGAKRRFSTFKLVEEIYMCLYPRIQQRQVNVIISQSLPIIYGDRQRFQTVFENLIVNAIKFSSTKRSPQIEICCKDKKKFYEFAVKDNGIGIDPENHQRIFEVFQKCSRRENDCEGTGVGLTIVKKIIEHHGGTIRVDSKLDKGAIFYFTFPKN